MAKGRKLGSSTRQERLLGSFGYGGGGGHGNGTTDLSSELVEDDVWSMVDDMDLADHHRDDHTRHPSPPMANGWSSNGSRNRRWISGGGGGDRREEERLVVGGLSMAFVDDTAGSGKAQASRIVHQFRQESVGSRRGSGHHNHHIATSAPMNVPDWPKILRVDSVESMNDSDDYGFGDGDSAERVPPHEYLAREYERIRKMTATSVLEGVGRTLKGRDMSRVRDAVWSQTGFYG